MTDARFLVDERATIAGSPYDAIVLRTPIIAEDGGARHPLLAPWVGGTLDASGETGGLDFIGDVHGCCDELEALLRRLGYRTERRENGGRRAVEIRAPAGRKVVLLGDLVDGGPRVAETLRLAMAVVRDGCGYAVLGNHDLRLLRYLCGYAVERRPGIDASIRELAERSIEEVRGVVSFLRTLPSSIAFAGGRIVASHTGMHAAGPNDRGDDVHFRAIRGKRTTPAGAGPLRRERETGEDRLSEPATHWTSAYRGEARVVYGHYRVGAVAWVGKTVCLDTGCAYGGRLSALRLPENRCESVESAGAYRTGVASSRPLPSGMRDLLAGTGDRRR